MRRLLALAAALVVLALTGCNEIALPDSTSGSARAETETQQDTSTTLRGGGHTFGGGY